MGLLWECKVVGRSVDYYGVVAPKQLSGAYIIDRKLPFTRRAAKPED